MKAVEGVKSAIWERSEFSEVGWQCGCGTLQVVMKDKDGSLVVKGGWLRGQPSRSIAGRGGVALVCTKGCGGELAICPEVVWDGGIVGTSSRPVRPEQDKAEWEVEREDGSGQGEEVWDEDEVWE